MERHPIAELYGRWALNPLVGLAYAVSHDFVVRPQLYRGVSDKVARVLSDFRFKTGTDSDWPNEYQRTLNFKLLYHLNKAAPAVRHTSLLLYEGSRKGAGDELAEELSNDASAFKELLTSLDGKAAIINCNQTRAVFEAATLVFQDAGVAAAFGLSPAPSKGWPLDGNFSGEAARLVGSIVDGLKGASCLSGSFRRVADQEQKLAPRVTVSLSPEKFITLQKAAYYGGSTISLALESGDHKELFRNAYAWTKALQQLIPDAARAWKDVKYRSKLTDLEWGMAPNPAGDPAPLGITATAASTCTVGCEVCCCSGDLDCDPTAVLTDFCTEFCQIV